MMAHFVRDHIGFGKIARGLEAVTQLTIEIKVDVELLVARAVERTRRRAGETAGGTRPTGEENQGRVDGRCGPPPRRSSARHPPYRRARWKRTAPPRHWAHLPAPVWRCSSPSGNEPVDRTTVQEIERIDTEKPAEKEQDENETDAAEATAAAADRKAQPAAGETPPPKPPKPPPVPRRSSTFPLSRRPCQRILASEPCAYQLRKGKESCRFSYKQISCSKGQLL